MTARNWTAEQHNAIHAQGGSVLVSAAAGSGKTAVLVERVITMLTREEFPIPADRVLVVTFTKAAAAEMKQRIAVALNERIAARPDDDFLLEQQLLLAKAHICTIHAFCGELLRDHFEQLDITPDFRIADETEIELLKRQTLDRILEDCYAQADAPFLELAEFFSGKTDQALADKIDTLYEFIRSHPFPLSWLDKQEECYGQAVSSGEYPWLAPVCQYLREAAVYGLELCGEAETLMSGDQTMAENYLPAFASDKHLLEEIRVLAVPSSWDTLVHKLRAYQFPSLKALRKYEDLEKKEAAAGLRDEIKAVVSECKKILDDASVSFDIKADLEILTPVLKTLFEVVRGFYTVLEEAKHEKNLLDFSDLELLALQLLSHENGERTKFAGEIGGRFEEILVDEYQDINEIQDAIFTALSRNGENLFWVGDVKQSIYRFRKAMPELFLKKSDGCTPFDGVHFPAKIRLDANFRSREEVTSAVNFFFARLMSPALGDVDYGKERLKAAAEYPEQDSCQTELHVIDHVDAADMEEERIVYEARHIAYEIRRMIAQGRTVTNGGAARRARYSDFCILMRSLKGKFSVFEEEFRKQGIPLWTDASAGYLGSEEVSVVLNLLKVLDNPLQDIPLLSVLLSPLFDFSPDELAGMRLLDKTKPLYLVLNQAAESGDEKAGEFLKVTGGLRRFGAVARLDQLIQYIYDTTGFLLFSSASQTGEQRTANLRLLLEYAGHYEETGHRGLSGFIRTIDRTIEQGGDLAGASVMNEAANVVRLMTIHRSKGLEFPICFVADLGKQFNTLDLRGDMLLHPEWGIALKVRDRRTMQRYSTLPYEALSLLIEQNMRSEELRVLYVALTRAKEKLILTTSCADFAAAVQSLRRKCRDSACPPAFLLRHQRCYADWIFTALLEHPAFCSTDGFGEKGEPCADVPVRASFYPPLSDEGAEELEVEDTSKIDEGLLAELKVRLAYRYPYEIAAHLPGKLTVSQIVAEHAVEFGEPARPAFLSGKGFTPAERGTILHRFMQHLDLYAENGADEIGRQRENGFLGGPESETLEAERIEKFLRSKLAEAMRNAGPNLRREFKFMYDLEANELYGKEAGGEQILIQGVADAIIVEPDGITIVDYKTDRVKSGEELSKRYHTQLELYGRALSHSFGLPVKRCVIYSLWLGEEVTVEKSLTI